jgi:hypothetical protein
VANDGSHAERAARLLASPRVRNAVPPRPDATWPFSHSEPPDLVAFYAACDGVELDDGVRIFGHGELRDVTAWLVLEKGLSWPEDLIVAGERRDSVIALDLDVGGVRAGGGVLEVGADDLGSFERVASGVLDYLLIRSGAGEDMAPPPEVEARRAARAGDRDTLERALRRPMYPGSERGMAALWLELGALHAAAGDAERALGAFEQSVAARLSAVGRGGRDVERVAAWTAAAHVARTRGAPGIAAECERRSRAR